MVWSVIIFGLLAGYGQAARILALVPFNTKSHYMVMEPFLQELAARGHQVTVFTSFPEKTTRANYTQVDFSSILPSMVNAFSIEMVKQILPNPWVTARFINTVSGKTCELLKEPEFQNLLKTKDQFDLVITELFGTDCMTYFAYKLRIPLISFTTSMAMPWAAERFGLPDNPSYIPNYLVSFPPDMNLWQRTYNTVILLYAKFWHLWVFSAQTRSLVEDAFGEPLPPLHEVVANTSLYLVNSYHALAQSRPLPPNVVEVGGIHIKERQPLPQDLKQLLDNAKDGVILMSLGSLVRSSSLPKSVIASFLSVFSKIPQTVIFKYEDELPEAPPNVVVRTWLPQRDIIEHKNVIAIIAHGGLGSTVEAVYFGKPLVGIPLFSDQFVNLKNVVRRGAGLQLDLDNLTESAVAAAVREITTNPKYREGMRRLSHQYRDRPMTALQSAVYWTEYVIRHKGAPNLKPGSVNLPLYQYLLLDVITVLFLGLCLVILIVLFVIKYALSTFVRRKSGKRNHSKKKFN